MNLKEATYENMAFMLNDLKKRLRMVNVSLIDPEDFRLDDYAEVRDIYEMVVRRPQLTTMQLEGVLTELGELRKRK